MILHALTRHYEDLLSLAGFPGQAGGQQKSPDALDLSLEGEILALLPLKTEQLRGKKAELLPRKMEVPMPVGRSGTKPKANFLCDHSGYFLGVDGKGNPKRAGECFAACKALHLELLEGLPSPAAQADHRIFPPMGPPDGLPTPGPRRELEGSDGRGQPGFLGWKARRHFGTRRSAPRGNPIITGAGTAPPCAAW